MRFLILTQYFPPEVGAPQVRLASMVRELLHLGHEVEIVTALPNYPLGRIFEGYRVRLYSRDTWEGVTVHRTWVYARMGGGLKRILNYASFTLMSLLGLCRAKRPDFVFVESPPLFLSLPARLACRLWRVPMIFNVADLWPYSVRAMGLLREGVVLRLAERLERWTYRKADYINAVTEGIRRTLVENRGVPPARVLFLPNGVDTGLFKPGRPDAELMRELDLDGRKVVLYAGTVGFAHGVEVAIEAMAELERDCPEVLLVVIGSGSEKEKIVGLAAAKHLPNVRFLEPAPLEFVARLYPIAYAGLSTLKNLPLFEGTRPSKLFPIMASGKPVLYSGAGEGARLVETARAGLVVPPEDGRALASAIRTLVEQPDMASEWGRNGRQYVESHLTWRALVEDWLGQLENSRLDAVRASGVPVAGD